MSQDERALVEGEPEFDYSALPKRTADLARAAAEAVKRLMRLAVEDVLAIGAHLLRMKDELPHGCFGQWVRCEFGLDEKKAQRHMAVAWRFAGKTDIMSDLAIVPTAAYELAAPSVPEAAREEAVRRARAGQKVTVAMAKQIIAETRGRRRSRPRSGPRTRLSRFLEGCLAEWEPSELPEPARRLREYADRAEPPPAATAAQAPEAQGPAASPISEG